MNLTEMRARVREDLQDTDSQNYRWTDDEIDGAIDRVVMEYSLHAPIQQQTDIATTDGDTELDISGLTGIVKIESVEFPIGESPTYLRHFEYWAGQLYNGIPVAVSDWVSDAYTVGTSSDCSAIFAFQMGEGAVCGLSSPEMIQVERLGSLETKDASRTRIKWYVSLALFSCVKAAMLTGVRD